MTSDLSPYPELLWIDLPLLQIDKTYQRSVEGKASQKLINAVAAGFDWALFTPPTICAIEDGKFNVIDGQHRVLAARKRGGIPKLPCYKIDAVSTQQQAAHFTALNQNRVRMHTVDMYHARLAAGESLARKVESACQAAGVRICKAPFQTAQMPPGMTQAVGTLERALQKHPRDAVIRSLKVLKEAHPETTGQLRSRMLEAMIRLYAVNFKDGRDLDDQKLAAVVGANDAYDLEMGARIQHETYGGDTAAGIIDALAEAYNEDQPAEGQILGQI
ncbi:MAG: hypothetical protein GC185_01950 [Alphaproteobacteria bacterium]|nr:hypothetical protein [Alphaproteobacteria bacterium]